jgi:hypothetical protein
MPEHCGAAAIRKIGLCVFAASVHACFHVGIQAIPSLLSAVAGGKEMVSMQMRTEKRTRKNTLVPHC